MLRVDVLQSIGDVRLGGCGSSSSRQRLQERERREEENAPSAAVVKSLTFFFANDTLVSTLFNSLEASRAARSAKVTSESRLLYEQDKSKVNQASPLEKATRGEQGIRERT